MIQKIRIFLDEQTHGLIHTRKEALYLVTIVVLTVVLVFSIYARVVA